MRDVIEQRDMIQLIETIIVYKFTNKSRYDLIEKIDQLNLLKARARYTLHKPLTFY